MAMFITRVELHNEKDYTALHQAMERLGFKRTIALNDGTTRHLPTAEYLYVGDLNTNDVIEKAKQAVRQIKKDASIVTTMSADMTTNGLPLAT